jgi:hypothetical protein
MVDNIDTAKFAEKLVLAAQFPAVAFGEMVQKYDAGVMPR